MTSTYHCRSRNETIVLCHRNQNITTMLINQTTQELRARMDIEVLVVMGL
jgi:hypothetical protein